MSKLSRIEFDATPEERKKLNEEAAAHGLSRKELIRERVFHPQRAASLGKGRDCIDRAIAAVNRQHKEIPRYQLEPIICTVICALAAEG
tara:strand:+ start:78 stop:344 length:267 start_codon:yes stop_codon:yes gene_type:complete